MEDTPSSSTTNSGSEEYDDTSGYNTDDEKDANDDELEETKEHNDSGLSLNANGGGIHGLHGHPTPPIEADVDEEGNPLYNPPEPLPRRQLRVLRDGDRILMRYYYRSSPGHRTLSERKEVPCVAKLEYLHYSTHRSHRPVRRRRPKATAIPIMADAVDKGPPEGITLGKPRLLSAKSADCKSSREKNRCRTLENSTSAANAPTTTDDDNDNAVNHNEKAAAADAINASGGRRTAVEDWSDVQSPKKGPEATATSSGKQAEVGKCDNAKEEDDCGGDQSSYLTGEVMVRDQDYVSPIAGDDATPMPPLSMALREGANEGVDERDKEKERDAATTASAVVLGTTAASPGKTTDVLSRELRGDGQRHGNTGEVKRAPLLETRRNEERGGEDGKSSEGGGEESNLNENKVEFIEEAGAEANEEEEIFLTALEHDIDDDDEHMKDEKEMEEEEEENNSEEELLSQSDGGDSSVKFEAVEDEQFEEDDESNDSEVDFSQTQPFILPKSVMNNTWVQSLSAAEEERDDDSTECPEEVYDQKIPSDVDQGEKVCSSLPAERGAMPKTADSGHESDDNWEEQPTQPWYPVIVDTNNNEDQNVSPDDNRTEEVCFTSPAKASALPETAEKEEAGEHSSDGFSDDELTQKFPSMKAPGGVRTNNQHEEEDEAYEAGTVTEDHVYLEETQTLIPPPFNLAATLTHSEDMATANKSMEESLDNARAQRELQIIPTNEESNSIAVNNTSFPGNDSLKESEQNIGTFTTRNDAEEGQVELPAKSEIPNNDISEGKDLIVSNPVAATPTAVKEQLSSDVRKRGGLKKGDDHKPEPTTSPPFTVKEPLEQASEHQNDARDAPLPPEKSSGALENGGLDKGKKYEPESTKPPLATAKEPPEQASERQAAAKDVSLPPGNSSSILEKGGAKRRVDLTLESSKPPPTKEPPGKVSECPVAVEHSSLPEKTSGILVNGGVRKGEGCDLESTKSPPTKKLHQATAEGPPEEASECQAAERDVPLPPENASGILEKNCGKKRIEQELESTKPPPTKESPEKISECQAIAKEPSPPEKTNGNQEHRGLRKGEEHALEPTKPSQTEESPDNIPECPSGVKDPLPPDEGEGVLENERIKTGGKQDPELTKLPPTNITPRRGSKCRQVHANTSPDDSAIQKQRHENSAVTRVPSGAIMTGPVGGAVALSNPSFPYSMPEKESPKKKASKKESTRQYPNLLTSIAAQQPVASNPKLLLDAAASSEETMVCHIDNLVLKVEQGSTAVESGTRNGKLTHSGLQKEEVLGERNDCADSIRNRDPNIPSTISCINTRIGQRRRSNKGLATPCHRPKRKRGVSSSGRRRESSEAVRIMFTGINPTCRHKQMIDDIGAHLVDSISDALTATHVIASDGKSKLRRTPKLMICLCKTSNILSIEWLEQSAKQQRVLDTNDFLLLDDREAEKRYNFSMKDTLENGRKARLDSGGILGSWYVYICGGVFGNQAPSAKELHLVVEATGATLLSDLKKISDPLKTIAITSDPSTQSQLKEQRVARLEGLGAKILTTSWLFHTIITQKISTSIAEGPPHSSRQSSKRKAIKSPPSHGNRRKSSRKR